MASKTGARRVSMAPNRLRRPKRDPSGLADLNEDGGGHPNRLKNAIYNEEIARLRIRDEDLNKISQEVRSAASVAALSAPVAEAASPRRIAVRREIPVALRRPPLRRFVLLRRAAPEKVTEPTEGFNRALPDEADDDQDADSVADDPWLQPRIQPTAPGPRIDSRGNVVPHSLLGRPEEFYKMGLRRGHLHPDDLPQAYRQLATASDADGARDNETAREAGPDASIDSRSCNSTGNDLQHQRTTSRGFALPALESTSKAAVQEVSARERNRRVLTESGFQMGRMTEQLDECQPASLSVRPHPSSAGRTSRGYFSPNGLVIGESGRTSAGAAAAGCPGQQRSARLAGPLYSFIGGWSYQKAVLLG